MISSDDLILSVVRRLHLTDDPELNGSQPRLLGTFTGPVMSPFKSGERHPGPYRSPSHLVPLFAAALARAKSQTWRPTHEQEPLERPVVQEIILTFLRVRTQFHRSSKNHFEFRMKHIVLQEAVSEDDLLSLMSEVISLQEQVAQAELRVERSRHFTSRPVAMAAPSSRARKRHSRARKRR